MNWKKSGASKRATLPRACDFTRQFLKDWERLSNSGRYDMTLLKELMSLLVANDGPLAAQWRDHALVGEWGKHRECHVGGDFLLVYRLETEGKFESVIFVRAGTHSELFR